MEDAINFTITLDPYYTPDPTWVTDYIALGMVCFYVGFFFLLCNVTVIYISRTWIAMKRVNIPLMSVMSCASSVQLVCTLLDMGYFPELTLSVQEHSCVLTNYWGEYVFGIVPVLACLFVWMYSLLMVSVDRIRPAGAAYRRTVVRVIVFTIFLMPIYLMCLRVTVNKHATFDDDTLRCVTPVQYKFSLVGILVTYICALMLMTWLLRKYDVRPHDSAAILDIVMVTVILLIVGCVVHFTYMLPHYWGRFTYMCVCFTLHVTAYARIVFPELWVYYTTKNNVARGIWNDEEWKDSSMPQNILSDPDVSADISRMSKSAVQLNALIDKHHIVMHPDFFIEMKDLREEFFAHCIIEMGDAQMASVEDEFQIVHSFDIPPVSVDVTCVISFYEMIDSIISEKDKKYSADEGVNKNIVLGNIARMVKSLSDKYLSEESSKFIGITPKSISRIRHGFTGKNLHAFDFDILCDFRKKVLGFLIEETYTSYSTRFREYIANLSETYKEKLNILCEDGYINKEDIDPNGARKNAYGLVSILKGERDTSPTGDDDDIEIDYDDMYSCPTEEYDDDDALQQSTRNTSRQTSKMVDEVQEDGSVIYSTPARATYFFIVDTAAALKGAPLLMYTRCINRRPESLEQTEVGLVS